MDSCVRRAFRGCLSQSLVAADSGARESDGSTGIDPHGYGFRFWAGLLFWKQKLLSTWSAYQYPTARNSQLSTSLGNLFLQKCTTVIISARGRCSISYCLRNTYLWRNLQIRSILIIATCNWIRPIGYYLFYYYLFKVTYLYTPPTELRPSHSL